MVGDPKICKIFQIWSNSLEPGNNGAKLITSAATAPNAHMSIGREYHCCRNKISGSLYHRVETYAVYVRILDMCLAKP